MKFDRSLRASALRLALICGPLLVGCGVLDSLRPAPTPVPTSAPTATPIRLPTALPTATPRPTPTPTATPPPESDIQENPDGSQTFVDWRYGYSITLPADWIVLALSEGDFEQIFGAAAEMVPDLAQLESMVNSVGPGGRMISIDPDPDRSAEGFMTNVNILAIQIPGDFSMDLMVRMNAESLPQLLEGVEVTRSEVITNANDLELGLIAYNYSFNYTESTVGASIIAALLQRGDATLTITFGSAASVAGLMEPTFDQILDSIRVLEVEG